MESEYCLYPFFKQVYLKLMFLNYLNVKIFYLKIKKK